MPRRLIAPFGCCAESNRTGRTDGRPRDTRQQAVDSSEMGAGTWHKSGRTRIKGGPEERARNGLIKGEGEGGRCQTENSKKQQARSGGRRRRPPEQSSREDAERCRERAKKGGRGKGHKRRAGPSRKRPAGCLFEAGGQRTGHGWTRTTRKITDKKRERERARGAGLGGARWPVHRRTSAISRAMRVETW